jgi:hypothetical protein
METTWSWSACHKLHYFTSSMLRIHGTRLIQCRCFFIYTTVFALSIQEDLRSANLKVVSFLYDFWLGCLESTSVCMAKHLSPLTTSTSYSRRTSSDQSAISGERSATYVIGISESANSLTLTSRSRLEAVMIRP